MNRVDDDVRAGAGGRVFRREVFYVPGFDPFHPRRYRELYRREGAAQAEISGYQISQRADGLTAWSVETEIGGQRSESRIEVLVWADIVQTSMSGTILGTYGQLLRTAWVYVASGALGRLLRLRIGPVLAALYPVAMLLCQAALAIGVVWLFLTLADLVLPEPVARHGAVRGALWAGALAAGWALLRGFKALDGTLFAYYLMHDYAFSARGRGATSPELTHRLEAFAAQVRHALEREDLDEVLVVGHSSGAHLAIEMLASLLRAGPLPETRPALAFLSLGQVVPMVSFLPEARGLRRDLAALAQSPALSWVDVTAPGDGASFALCDPVGVSGVAPEGRRWPLVISAAFTRTLSPAKRRELGRRFFRRHFQYLCAFDRPGDYDYFQITAGPQTLAARFAGRKPSPSLKSAAVSKYRDMAP